MPLSQTRGAPPLCPDSTTQQQSATKLRRVAINRRHLAVGQEVADLCLGLSLAGTGKLEAILDPVLGMARPRHGIGGQTRLGLPPRDLHSAQNGPWLAPAPHALAHRTMVSQDHADRHPHTPPPNSPTHRTRILVSGKMGKMNKNGGKWGGEWGNSGHSTRDVGCGGLWRDVPEENWTTIEKNGRKMGENTHCSQSHFPIFPQFLL